MLGRILQILIKELLELSRDRWGRFSLLAPPIIQLLLFGYAATFEVNAVTTAVLDLDHSQESRELVSAFTGSGRFRIIRVAADEAGITDAIERGDAAVALVIHPGFAQRLRKGQKAPLQVLVDGTNSNTALLALGYVGQIVGTYSTAHMIDLANRVLPGPRTQLVEVRLEERPWFNPGLDSRWFFVPGIVGTVTLVSVVNLTAFAIVREREVGTLEQIMVTPIRPFELLIGKTLPLYLIGIGQVFMLLVTGMIWFGVPFVGDPFVLFVGTSLFLLTSISLGLLISTVCTTQQQAFASNFFVINPIFMLSGFTTPITTMPAAMQALTYVNPLSYYLVITRGTFLKGVGFGVLWPDMLALAALGLGLLGLTILRFRKSLD
ncbi:MAG TPA: ABC transporter permease [Stellaceae bacterium]|nr:ABC transporter permease [Stellaceae bacterium]